MIKNQQSLSKLQKSEPYYRITATLLNSWQNIFDCEQYVKDSDNADVCYEIKVQEKREEAYQNFVNLLYRKPMEQTDAMKLGCQYEADVYAGKDEVFSPIVENGTFQLTVKKKVIVDNTRVLLYGVLDVLKCGKIYDIKRTSYYKYGKFKNSHQHPMYLYLVPSGMDFTYLVYDGKEHHTEEYLRENTENILEVISIFIRWLKANELFDVWVEKWAMYE